VVITLAEGDVMTLEASSESDAKQWYDALSYAKANAPAPSYLGTPPLVASEAEDEFGYKSNTQIRVTVPDSLAEDRKTEVAAPDGRLIEVQIPEGLLPGTVFVFDIPPPDPKPVGFFGRVFGLGKKKEEEDVASKEMGGGEMGMDGNGMGGGHNHGQREFDQGGQQAGYAQQGGYNQQQGGYNQQQYGGQQQQYGGQQQFGGGVSPTTQAADDFWN
jgi:hypothetical protein